MGPDLPHRPCSTGSAFSSLIEASEGSEMRKNRFCAAFTGALVAAVLLYGCGGGGGGGGGDDGGDPATTNNKLVVLNHMTPTGYVRDGVETYGLKGPSSRDTDDAFFDFARPLPYGESETVYLGDDQCDLYWDLTPMAADSLNLIPNIGKPFFVPCGKTLACTATIKVVDFPGSKVRFADLDCATPQ